MTARRSLSETTEHAYRVALNHDGLISRSELGRLGVDRFAIRNQVRAGRWLEHGDQCVNGIPRVRPDVAAVRAAHWAVSDLCRRRKLPEPSIRGEGVARVGV